VELPDELQTAHAFWSRSYVADAKAISARRATSAGALALRPCARGRNGEAVVSTSRGGAISHHTLLRARARSRWMKATISEGGDAEQLPLLSADSLARTAVDLLLGRADGRLFEVVYHVDCESSLSGLAPIAARGTGPTGMRQLSRWISRSFADVRAEVVDVLVSDDQIAVWVDVTAHQLRALSVHNSLGSLQSTVPLTSSPTTSTQIHWLSLYRSQVLSHDVALVAGERWPGQGV
jgi:hypothetical protein